MSIWNRLHILNYFYKKTQINTNIDKAISLHDEDNYYEP